MNFNWSSHCCYCHKTVCIAGDVSVFLGFSFCLGWQKLTPHISGETASCGHPKLDVWVLIHYNQCCLSVYRWPLQHCIVFSASQVKVQASVAPCEIGVTTQRYHPNPVTVAFRAVETRAVEDRFIGSRFHDFGEVLDPPHSVGTAGLAQADVVDVSAPSGCRGVTADGLESVTKLHPHFHWDVGDLPCVVGVRWETNRAKGHIQKRFYAIWTLCFVCTHLENVLTFKLEIYCPITIKSKVLTRYMSS